MASKEEEIWLCAALLLGYATNLGTVKSRRRDVLKKVKSYPSVYVCEAINM